LLQLKIIKAKVVFGRIRCYKDKEDIITSIFSGKCDLADDIQMYASEDCKNDYEALVNGFPKFLEATKGVMEKMIEGKNKTEKIQFSRLEDIVDYLPYVIACSGRSDEGEYITLSSKSSTKEDREEIYETSHKIIDISYYENELTKFKKYLGMI
jgi:hypothetical protein